MRSQARIAELEGDRSTANGAQKDVQDLRAVLEKTQSALDSEKQRAQQLEKELEATKLAQGNTNVDAVRTWHGSGSRVTVRESQPAAS